MIDPRTNDPLLDMPPYSWGTEEVEQAKRRFQELRPAVPLRWVKALWHYRIQLRPDQPLFDDPHDDLALVLHAKAIGEHVPAGSGDFIDRLLEEHAPSYSPVIPEPAVWGARAAISREVRAALPSPLMYAWVMTNSQGAAEVLVIGNGVREIRHRVEHAAFRAALRINALTDPKDIGVVDALLNVGLIRVVGQPDDKHAVIDIPPVLDVKQVGPAPGKLATARDALNEFIAVLRSLERTTRLVKLTEIPQDRVADLSQRLRGLPRLAGGESIMLVPEMSGTEEPAVAPAVTVLPYRTVPRAEPLWLRLTPDLLDTASYRNLEEAHQRAMAGRLTMDAKLRRDYYEAEAEALRADLAAYKKASPEERKAGWDEELLLNVRFDHAMGLTILLANPKPVPTEVYYRDNVPNLIMHYDEWAERMRELVVALEAAVTRPHAPARQFAAARFLDAVIRGITPDESAATTQAFRHWRDEVQPMLWLEWRNMLGEKKINDAFTPHTSLSTLYQPPTDQQTGTLMVQPCSIVDESRSLVLSDVDRGIVVVRDATDHIERVAPPVADQDSAAETWQHLKDLAERSTTTEAEFGAAFLTALRGDPHGTAGRMIKALGPEDPPTREAATIADEFRETRRIQSIATGVERALSATRGDAFHTAREALNGIENNEPHNLARAWLLRAFVECAAADIPYTRIPDLLGGSLPGLPSAAEHALDQALESEELITRDWQQFLSNSDLDKALRRLMRRLPRVTEQGSRQHAIWLFHSALAEIQVARELNKSADELSEMTEALDTALMKVGRTLEHALVGEFLGGFRNEARELLELFTGEELPKYGSLD